ncbi:HlyD family efflux transporter periplasmic adaptor subunit [bacterium]|jgi:HlyD family secretion protein|nr:HlyD family efflux transporter periplasmic adaptor subunit [bacterium]
MSRSLILPIIAAGAMLFMGYHLLISNREPAMQPPPIMPAKSPFGKTLAGAGIVEAKTENLSIGTLVPGIVVERAVEVGQQVQAGDLLFRIDDRQTRADLKVRESRLAAAESKLHRLHSMPRPEQIPPSEANVARFRAEFAAARDLLDRSEKLYTARSIGEEELIQRKQKASAAQEALSQAVAEDQLLKKGAWEEDIHVASSDVDEARTLVDQATIELQRLEVRAPIAGEVLQVNVRLGEYVGTPPGEALVVLGNLQALRVRIDVDESDIPDYRSGMPARAYVRGNNKSEIPMHFVRVEPFVVPKKSLTRRAGEQVDTRVLQVIYEIDSRSMPVFVGQQLDVFFDEESPASSKASSVADNSAGPGLSP